MKLGTVTLPLPDGGEVNAQRAVRWQTYQLDENGERTIGLSLHDEQGRAIVVRFDWDELAAFQKHLNVRAMEIDTRHKVRPKLIGMGGDEG